LSSITITTTKDALSEHVSQYRAWRLTVSATDAVKTNGATDDPNIFVMRTNRNVNGDIEIFSHVSSLYEMNNLPDSDSKAEIPPKRPGMYRSSLIKFDAQNVIDLEDAIDLIKYDVDLLMRAAGNSSDATSEVFEYSPTPVDEFNTIRYGVSDKSINDLAQPDVNGFETAVSDSPTIGHSGSLTPDDEYIYILYPADRGICTTFSLGGFPTTAWSYITKEFYDSETESDQTFLVYRSDHKLGTYPEPVDYEIS